MALDPELPEPDELEVLDPLEPLDPLDPLDPPDRGGADRTGCDCGEEGIDGISRLLDPPPLDVEELGGGGGGGASLDVVVRGIAWAAAIAGIETPAAIAETRSKRQLIRMGLPPTFVSATLLPAAPP